MTKVLIALMCAAMVTTNVQGSQPSEDAAKFVAVSHLKKGRALSARGRLEAAEKEFDLAIVSYPDGAALYGERGRARYERKNYTGAIEDFDVYLKAKPEDSTLRFLRSLAKSLLKPEDIIGACADFLTIREQAKDLDLGKYCNGQAGWPEK